MTTEQKAEAYDLALERAKKWYNAPNIDKMPTYGNRIIEEIFPELKKPEDEEIRKGIIHNLKYLANKAQGFVKDELEERIAWLEKQVPVDEEKVLIGARKDVALSIMNFFNKNTLGMCLSNMECEDLEDAVVNSDWLKVYRYMKKKLEKQDKQKEINLVEILKHCPRETELYSPLYGKLWLAEVDEKNGIITCYKHSLKKDCVRAILQQEDTVSFYSNGTTGLPDYTVSKDCMLFLYDIEKQNEQKPVNKIEISDEYKGLTDFERVLADICTGWIGKELGWKQYIKDNADILLKFKQRPTWSNKDEEMLKHTIGAVWAADYYTYDDKKEIEKWLRSLRPQMQWKPSDAELEVLRLVAEKDGTCLMGLYEQLKKLK